MGDCHFFPAALTLFMTVRFQVDFGLPRYSVNLTDSKKAGAQLVSVSCGLPIVPFTSPEPHIQLFKVSYFL